MSLSYTVPGIMLSGGGSGNASGLSNPGQLEIMYRNLLSGSADIVSSLGVRTLVMTSGAIGTAGLIQIGNTETADEVEQNRIVLKEIADFCNANGIQVAVQAVLTNDATYGSGPTAINALVDQWATVAASVNLPICSVQDVQEIGISQSVTEFARLADVEANAVSTLIRAYSQSGYKMSASNLAVGDMEGGDVSTVASIAQWWNAYNAAAAVAGVAGFSSVTTDTGWFTPWIHENALPTWHAAMSAMSALASAYNMDMNVTIQGSEADLSANQFIRQAEQNAIELAKLEATGAVHVTNLLIQSWNPIPVGVNEISSPTSSTNEAAEIQAVYPLYLSGMISAQGAVSLNAPGQLLLNTGTVSPLGSLSITWSTDDVRLNNRLAAVLIDQTGTLTAVQHGMGTVSKPSANILVLSGNAADLDAELRSLTLAETHAGADTVYVEIYGSSGRVADGRVNVLAADPGQAVGTIGATSDRQGWISSSALLNHGTVVASGSVMTQETLHWSTTGTIAGQVAFLKTVAVHEPLAQYGIKNVSSLTLGTTTDVVASFFDPAVDTAAFPSGGYANYVGHNNLSLAPLPQWLPDCFDPTTQLRPLVVESTVNKFNAETGALETSVDSLRPAPITVVDLTGTHKNTFATAFDNGGTQVTEYNTGSNPEWLAGWGNQFKSATLTYDGNGHLVEAFLSGGASNPWFSVDYVFNPNNGHLWEIFQSTSPPPQGTGTGKYIGTNNPYQQGFATGPVYVTEFNTGDNPNWDYLDLGNSISSYTEVRTDYLVMENFSGFAINFPDQYPGGVNSYAYEFVNGPTLDLMYMPGAIDVNLNALGTVILNSQTLATGLRGLSAIDAAWATGTVSLTGLLAGGSTLIGGGNTSTITGYGHDTIVAGAGTTTISTGCGFSTIQITNETSNVTICGDNNIVSAAAGSTITLIGGPETVNGSNLTIFANNDISLTVNGTDNIIVCTESRMNIIARGHNSISISDTAAHISENLNALECLSANGNLTSITFSDNEAHTLRLSTAQISADAGALSRISSDFSLSPLAAANDFSGDGTSDILFQHDSGLVLDWKMSNGAFSTSRIIAGASSDWQQVGTGHFHDNNTSDILFQNTNSGLVLDWQMSNGAFASSGAIAGAAVDWKVIGTGDFNGDGTSDILFQNANSGLVLDWQMLNGAFGTSNAIAGATFDWKFIGNGDFNGDGTSDILFQNTNSGLLLDWQMSNNTLSQSVPIAGANPDWKVTGIGDFTGSGTSDILFQNSNSGALLFWEMSNGALIRGVSIGTLAAGQTVVAVGDYNGDGTDDILIGNGSGSVFDWQMSNGTLSRNMPVGGASNDWHLIK